MSVGLEWSSSILHKFKKKYKKKLNLIFKIIKTVLGHSVKSLNLQSLFFHHYSQRYYILHSIQSLSKKKTLNIFLRKYINTQNGKTNILFCFTSQLEKFQINFSCSNPFQKRSQTKNEELQSFHKIVQI